MRPVVIVIATLTLAAGGVIGFALPAGAGTATEFTATVDTLPVTNATQSIAFSGDKPSGSVISSVQIDNPSRQGISSCTGLDSGSTAWSCEFPSAGGESSTLNEGTANIEIDVTDAAGTVVHNILSFDVLNDPEYGGPAPLPVAPGATGYALRSYVFTPGAVTITGTPSPEASYVAMELEFPGEGWDDIQSCPEGNSAFDGGDFTGVPAGVVGCTVTGLGDNQNYGYSNNFYRVESAEGIGAEDPTESPNGGYDGFAMLPSPVITAATPNSDRSVNVSGTGGADGSSVQIYDGSSKVVCAVATTGTDWTCTTSALSIGSHHLSAVVVDNGAGNTGEFYNTYYLTGGMSAYSPAKTVTFAAAVAPTPVASTPALSAPSTDDAWTFTLDGIDPDNVHPGDTFTVDGAGAPAGVSFDTVIHSDPVDLGTATSGSDGSFSLNATIPTDTPPGPHHIEVTASGVGVTPTTKSLAITVVPAAVAASGSGTTRTKPAKTVHAAPEPEHSKVAALQPNILTSALAPIKDVVVHPSKIVSAFEIGLVLLLLAVLPAHLLNATLAEQSERFERRFGRRRPTPGWITHLVGWFRSAPIVGGLIVTSATAILFGFADPAFGFTLASLRLVLACAIAMFFVGYLANALTGAIARAAWQVEVVVRTRPWGLILTIVGVLASRLLHFSPGFLIGLILGLAIEGRAAAGFAWRIVVVRTSIVLAMGILAWIGYSTLTLGGNEGGSFWSALLVETLVAITTEGIVALLVELLPLRFLEGERVFAHSKPLWGFLYVVTVIVFVLAVIPWEGNWDALGGALWIWIVVLAAFAALCLGVYVYFRRFAAPLDEGDDEDGEDVPLGETVGAND